MRIVGGMASGRKIEAPPGEATRPTSERVREALFNSLAKEVQGARVLDLYGGSGALSLEALSWGAQSAVICEPRAVAVKVIRRNAEVLGMQGRIRLLAITAEQALARLRAERTPFDLALCDPPWQLGMSRQALEGLQRVLVPGATIVIEHVSTEEGPTILGASLTRSRRYGRTSLSYYRLNEPGRAEEAERL